MMDSVSLHQVVQRLEEQQIDYKEIGLENGCRLLVTQHGGRILGPFESYQSESLLWINSCFSNEDRFAQFLASGDWNLGGDRIWIAPELGFNVKDREHFFDSYKLPRQVDPGKYTLEKGDHDKVILMQEMCLDVFGHASVTQKQLHIEKVVRSVQDPLKYTSSYDELVEGIVFCGYEQAIRMSEIKADEMMSEVWNLTQLNPGGQLYICTTPAAEVTDYYEPVSEYLKRSGHHHTLNITGNRRYKVGYKSAHIMGRIGYCSSQKDGQSVLLIRNFFNNPSSPYVKEPPHLPGCMGHSVHVYNDNGEYGGFGELECNGQTIGGMTRQSSSLDSFISWFYIGEDEKLKKIMLLLLGLEEERV